VLADARQCAGIGLAWEDPEGLTRAQAACVLHLAVVLANWDLMLQRVEVAAEDERRALEHQRRRNERTAAKAIWGTPSPSQRREEPKELRSLRDLAHVSDAFNQWDEEGEGHD
jgi:hypothetical protein